MNPIAKHPKKLKKKEISIPKYKVGDKVIISKPEEGHRFGQNFAWVLAMNFLDKTTGIIRQVNQSLYSSFTYRLEGHTWGFEEAWLSPVEDYKLPKELFEI